MSRSLKVQITETVKGIVKGIARLDTAFHHNRMLMERIEVTPRLGLFTEYPTPALLFSRRATGMLLLDETRKESLEFMTVQQRKTLENLFNVNQELGFKNKVKAIPHLETVSVEFFKPVEREKVFQRKKGEKYET